MKRSWVAGVLLVLAGCASSQDEGSLVGRATFIDANGQPAGDALLYSAAAGIRVVANLPDLPEGQHGFHVHAVGSCQPPSFESAGSHHNPTNRQHGLQNPNGPHAGDMPNVGGRMPVTFVVEGLAVTGPNGIFDADGSAIVVHADADDMKTDPSGNSGARIRCGVIERP